MSWITQILLIFLFFAIGLSIDHAVEKEKELVAVMWMIEKDLSQAK